MTTRTRTRRVSLAKPTVTPDRVTVGDTVWTRDEDGQPYGASIGWGLALEQGVREMPRAGAR